jgi:DNA-binding response OmpR family regulator
MDTNKKKILFAEDNESLTKIVLYMLGKEGYEVFHYPSGENVVAGIKEHKPDLILTDVMMPVKNGLTILKEIKENPDTKDIPLIFLSSNNNDLSIQDGLDLGAADYILKPFSIEDLSARIKKQLNIK